MFTITTDTSTYYYDNDYGKFYNSDFSMLILDKNDEVYKDITSKDNCKQLAIVVGDANGYPCNNKHITRNETNCKPISINKFLDKLHIYLDKHSDIKNIQFVGRNISKHCDRIIRIMDEFPILSFYLYIGNHNVSYKFINTCMNYDCIIHFDYYNQHNNTQNFLINAYSDRILPSIILTNKFPNLMTTYENLINQYKLYNNKLLTLLSVDIENSKRISIPTYNIMTNSIYEFLSKYEKSACMEFGWFFNDALYPLQNPGLDSGSSVNVCTMNVGVPHIVDLSGNVISCPNCGSDIKLIDNINNTYSSLENCDKYVNHIFSPELCSSYVKQKCSSCLVKRYCEKCYQDTSFRGFTKNCKRTITKYTPLFLYFCNELFNSNSINVNLFK